MSLYCSSIHFSTQWSRCCDPKSYKLKQTITIYKNFKTEYTNSGLYGLFLALHLYKYTKINTLLPVSLHLKPTDIKSPLNILRVMSSTGWTRKKLPSPPHLALHWNTMEGSCVYFSAVRVTIIQVLKKLPVLTFHTVHPLIFHVSSVTSSFRSSDQACQELIISTLVTCTSWGTKNIHDRWHMKSTCKKVNRMECQS